MAVFDVAHDETIPFLDLVSLHRTLEVELVEACREAIRGASFVGGPEVTGFEKDFAAYCGAADCVGVSSGTDALRFAYMAMGLNAGQEVITVAHTFIATTEAITQAGGSFRFVDIDSETLTMDPSLVREAITDRSVGIVPVHLYGQPADMDPILELAKEHGLWVVEDAAQAHGALYKGRRVGSMGALAAFSFYPGKNLGACGEAGAIVGNTSGHMATMRRLRDHGQASKYHHDSEGYNGRLDAIQAAILRRKLPHLDAWNEDRRRVAAAYRQELAAIAEIRVPVEAPYAHHVYHLFVVLADRRDELQQHLSDRRIGTGLHYPIPLHLQRAYRQHGNAGGTLPVTEFAAAHALSLPMYPGLSHERIARIGDAIRGFYGR